MKVRKLKDGDLIEVGDRIKTEHRGIGGTRWETVERVTPKFAFDKYYKYRREYSDFGFGPIPRDTWSMSSYSAWRPINASSAAGERKEST